MSGEDESLFRMRAQFAEPLLGTLNQKGMIEAVNQPVCDATSLSSAHLIGSHWQEFADPGTMLVEQNLLDRVWHSEKPVYTRLKRRLTDSKILYEVQRISISILRDGAKCFLRESYCIDLNDFTSALRPNELVRANEVEALPYIGNQLSFLRGVALQNGEDFLAYLLEMAQLEISQRRDRERELTNRLT